MENIKINNHKELEFEGKKHVYKLNGFVIPSVTTIMKPLSAFCYRGVDEESLRRAAGRGTAVHEAVENYLLFGIEDAPTEYEGYFQAFKKWIDERKPEVLATEHRLYHKYLMYAGTADLLCLIDGISKYGQCNRLFASPFMAVAGVPLVAALIFCHHRKIALFTAVFKSL